MFFSGIGVWGQLQSQSSKKEAGGFFRLSLARRMSRAEVTA